MLIVTCHPERVPTLSSTLTAPFAIDRAYLANPFCHFGAISNEESGNAVIDHFGRRALSKRYDRRPNEHRLDHDESERLFPLYRKYRRTSAPHDFQLWLHRHF